MAENSAIVLSLTQKAVCSDTFKPLIYLSESFHVLFSYDDDINNTICKVEERLLEFLVVFLNDS